MNKRVVIAAVLIFSLVLALTVADASAYGYGKDKGHKKDMGEMFTCKAHMILKNKEELGLSDDLVKKIKALKVTTKKDLIRRKAEIEIIAIDIKAIMWADVIDTEAANKLIDAKYDLKKEKAKASLAAYATLLGLLSDDQKEKLKEIRKKCKKDKKGSGKQR